jgi:uncharacterized phage protein gp47/JayE
MASGLQPGGFIPKRLAELREQLAELISSAEGFANGAATGSLSVLGKLIGVFSAELDLVWQALQQVYDSFSPDAAEGEQLNNLCAITGIVRNDATSTTGPVELTGTNGTVIPVGSIVRIPNGAEFLTDAEVTITGGVATVDVSATATGPVIALANSVTEIVTAIAGWSTVDNAAALTTGRDVESDAELRARRELSLQVVGAATDGAIEARVATIDEVIEVQVFSNRTMVTDANNTPPKAFQTVVWSGSPPAASDEEVIAQIFLVMPAGIEPYGSITGTVTDAKGKQQTVGYSPAVEQELHVTVVLVTDSEFPLDGLQQVEDAIVEAGADFGIGDDVHLLTFTCAAAEVAGVIGVTTTAKIGSTPGPGDTSDITIAAIEIATLVAPNVTVS